VVDEADDREVGDAADQDHRPDQSHRSHGCLVRDISGKAFNSRGSARALAGSLSTPQDRAKGEVMAKDHGSSVKNDKQYEGLRKKGMSKERAAKIANASGSSKKGGENSGGGGGKSQKQKAGSKGGKKSS
jgi:hypothetical protein